MQHKGLSEKQVIAKLKKTRKLDLNYKDGRIFCSMCTKPHPLAAKAHRLFIESNLGDPGLFEGSAQLEKEAVKALSTLLNNENSCGFIVSGGTEANLLALLAARNIADAKNPEVVLPKSAHFSFEKICGMLQLKPVYADLDDSFRVNPVSVEKCISNSTVAIVGVAGTPELGVVDPIEKLSEIALSHKVYLHVDAAFGGLVIPFLSNDWRFDFSLKGVQSITVDPHKMGLATIPAGGILFREDKILDFIKTKTPYLTEDGQYTFVGTRTGASAAATWAVFNFLGREGFKKIVDDCLQVTSFLATGLEQNGLKLVTKPMLNVLAFRSENTKLLAEKLLSRGWFVSYIPRLDCIRIVVMPHIRKRDATAFLKDLCEIRKSFNM